MRLASRFLAWTLVVAILTLSVVPPSVRPTTQASHGFEHLTIFLCAGVAFAIGYPNRLKILPGLLVMFCATIEVIQVWVPGRHARLSDFVVDAVASCLGVGLVYAAQWLKAATLVGR